ncbi:putative pyrroline-5-carboxylate reductase [Proteus penneri ATCC 35198]|nr:putative pyrroline-5-carboxylate reductase [Proteus penneri ATCC 35198]
MEHRNIAFIGAGNMAQAIIAGLVQGGYPAHKITVSSPSSVRREPLEKSSAFIVLMTILMLFKKQMLLYWQ